MTALVHRIRVRTYHWAEVPSLSQLEKIVNQINERARDKRMLGQIVGVGDHVGRVRIQTASHIVMPTAQIIGSSIVVDVEVLEGTGQGRTLVAFIKAGVPIMGVLRGVRGISFGSARIFGVDIDINNNPEETVLDDIVDALEVADIQG